MSEDKQYYEGKLQIDRHALDDALVEQPETFHSVSKAYVYAVSNRDELKDKIRKTDANLYLEIREEAALNKEKLTEAAVQARLEVHESHTAAREAYLESCKQADLWQALKEAFQQRSYVLKDLAGLYISGYYATTSVKGKASKEVEEIADNTRKEAIHEKRQELQEKRVVRKKLKEEQPHC
jgi:hypothetical protein